MAFLYDSFGRKHQMKARSRWWFQASFNPARSFPIWLNHICQILLKSPTRRSFPWLWRLLKVIQWFGWCIPNTLAHFRSSQLHSKSYCPIATVYRPLPATAPGVASFNMGCIPQSWLQLEMPEQKEALKHLSSCKVPNEYKLIQEK